MTYGARIEELADEYTALYDSLKTEFGAEKAAALATHDFGMKIFVYQEALKLLQAHIAKAEAAE